MPGPAVGRSRLQAPALHATTSSTQAPPPPQTPHLKMSIVFRHGTIVDGNVRPPRRTPPHFFAHRRNARALIQCVRPWAIVPSGSCVSVVALKRAGRRPVRRRCRHQGRQDHRRRSQPPRHWRAGGRRHRQARHAGMDRRSQPLRRAVHVGSAPLAVGVRRRDDRGDGQLRGRGGAVPQGRPRLHDPPARGRGGHPRGVDRRGSEVGG